MTERRRVETNSEKVRELRLHSRGRKKNCNERKKRKRNRERGSEE